MTREAPENRAEQIAEVLGEHFVMWRDLDGLFAGEWFCQCGEKFAYSDNAVRHQTAALDAALAAQEGGRGGTEIAATRLREVRAYVDDPGNWSALDGRRRLLMRLIDGIEEIA